MPEYRGEDPQFKLPDEAILAKTFNAEAAAYDGNRPGYPVSLFDGIVTETGLGRESTILEIGCGTGQATLPMAEKGYDITAVEPGEKLASIARNKLRAYSKVKVINSSFEAAELPLEAFDLALAAMSLHWVDETVRFRKVRDCLKSTGHLAILYNYPLATAESANFYEALAGVAQRYDFPEGAFQPIPEEELGIRPEIDTKYFEQPDFYLQKMKFRYGSGLRYAGHLATLSAVIALPESPRFKFLGDVAETIRQEFDDTLELPFASTLALARRK